MDMFNKLKKAQENIDELRRQMNERFKEEFKPAMREWLATTPEIVSIRWRQYTPYFNDGDACSFGMHDVYYKPAPNINVNSKYGSDYDDGFYGPYQFTESPELETKLRELTKLLYSFSDTFEVVFGDHTMITISDQEIEVEEYDHD